MNYYENITHCPLCNGLLYNSVKKLLYKSCYTRHYIIFPNVDSNLIEGEFYEEKVLINSDLKNYYASYFPGSGDITFVYFADKELITTMDSSLFTLKGKQLFNPELLTLIQNAILLG